MMPVPQLKRLRLERFMSQEDLADHSGVGRATIQRLESGLPARVSTIRRLAQALSVEPKALVGEEQAPDQGQQEAA